MFMRRRPDKCVRAAMDPARVGGKPAAHMDYRGKAAPVLIMHAAFRVTVYSAHISCVVCGSLRTCSLLRDWANPLLLPGKPLSNQAYNSHFYETRIDLPCIRFSDDLA